MSIAVLFNPISGTGRALRVAQAIAEGLARRGIATRLLPTERGRPKDWLREKLDDVEAVVVAGGDGAVRSVVHESARADLPLWHAPCGTENLFARTFGMTRNPEHVAAAHLACRTRRVDVGECSGARFAIMASVGFDAEVVRLVSARRRGAISRLTYARPIIELVGSWRAPVLSWTIDGESEWLGPGMAVVANLAPYGGFLHPARHAAPDDGLLDAVFIPAERALDLVPAALALWARRGEALPGFRYRTGRSIEIHADRPVSSQLDGDPSGLAPLEHLSLRLRPGVLRVLVREGPPVGSAPVVGNARPMRSEEASVDVLKRRTG